MKIQLKEGQSICFCNEGATSFCACKSTDVKKVFDIDLESEGCSFYVNDYYAGRIICQGFKIYDKDHNVIYEEGRTIK